MRYFLLFLLLLLAPLASATRYGDVDVSPIGSEQAATIHGYAPYRFRVINSGLKPMRVGLSLRTYSANQNGITQLQREVEVPASATIELTLYQPAQNFSVHACDVFLNGRQQEDVLSVSPLNHGQYGNNEGFMLTTNRLSSDERDALAIEQNATVVAHSGNGDQDDEKNKLLINITSTSPIGEFPTDWLSFSRWDSVCLTRDEFEIMPIAVRSGLMNWVKAGGQLLVVHASKSDVPQEWTGLSVSGAKGCLTRGVGLGRVIFIPPSNASALSAAGHAAFNFAVSEKNAATHEPTCPPVASGEVPIRGMFLLMLVFAILVGPINYIICARKNKRVWMLWTSPALAGVFVFAVFAYALLSDGIRPWGQSEVITLLDEKEHYAVTLGCTSWYAPMLPSSGLTFKPNTEVRLSSSEYRGRGYSSDAHSGLGVIQGAAQQLTGGWMVPRVPETFGYRKMDDSRLRLKFEKDANGDIWVVNGLGVDIDSLEVHANKKVMHCDALTVEVGRVKLLAGASPQKEHVMDSAVAPVMAEVATSTPVDEEPKAKGIIAEPKTDHWVAKLSKPLFAEVPFGSFRKHDISETVIGKMEEPLP